MSFLFHTLHTLALTRTRTHTHTHTHSHPRTHARMHARTHVHARSGTHKRDRETERDRHIWALEYGLLRLPNPLRPTFYLPTVHNFCGIYALASCRQPTLSVGYLACVDIGLAEATCNWWDNDLQGDRNTEKPGLNHFHFCPWEWCRVEVKKEQVSVQDSRVPAKLTWRRFQWGTVKGEGFFPRTLVDKVTIPQFFTSIPTSLTEGSSCLVVS